MNTRDNFISKCLFAQENILLVNMINSQSLTCVHFDPPGSLSQPALPCHPATSSMQRSASHIPGAQHQTKSPKGTRDEETSTSQTCTAQLVQDAF